jgi:hypothetical protein
VSSSEQGRWRRIEGDYPIGHALFDDRRQITATPQHDRTWIVTQPGARARSYDSLEQLNDEITARNGTRTMNTLKHSGYVGTGAFFGSLAGVGVGSLLAMASPESLSGAVPIGLALLSAGGGVLGARYMAPEDRQNRATVGGGVGGLFGPIGAAIGGYAAGRKPDKIKENPATGTIAAVAAGTAVLVGGVAYAVHRSRANKKAILQPEIPVPTPMPRTNPGMRSMSRARQLPATRVRPSAVSRTPGLAAVAARSRSRYSQPALHASR